MTPKYVQPSDPDRVFEIGKIKIVRIGKTIYLYTNRSIHPLMTQKIGDSGTAMLLFNVLKNGLESIVLKERKRSRLHIIRQVFKR